VSQIIHYYSFNSQLEEFLWVANKVQDLLKNGTKPAEIAIISRKHKDLIELAQIFQFYSVPIFYEKSQDILQKSPIHQLITILQFLNTINQKDQLEADELLPEILSYPFWTVEPLDIWRLSIFTYQQTKDERLWLNWMLKAEEVEVFGEKLAKPELLKNIAEFLLDLSQKCKYLPVEQVIDLVIGNFETQNEDEDGEIMDKSKTSFFNSNFKNYYFDSLIDQTKEQKTISITAVDFLSNLRVLIDSVKSHYSRQFLLVSDFVTFLDLLEKNKIPLLDKTSFGNSETGVNLLTAHKAKGLEFEKVFIICCNQENWFGKAKFDLLDLPTNLPIMADKEDLDDQIRLFFVAITRAKDNLYLTRYKTKDDGKPTSAITLLEESLKQIPHQTNWQLTRAEGNHKNEIYQALILWKNSKKEIKLSDDQKNLLAPLLKNYKLSVTHLNNFLDIVNGGPLKFLQQNLLKFPQSKSVSACYGTAMHETIRFFIENYKNEPRVNLEKVIEHFKTSLSLQRLSSNDFEKSFKKGQANLEIFYNQFKKADFGNVVLEYDFSLANIWLDGVNLAGKIDLIQIFGDKIIVTEFKTGKPLQDLGKVSDLDKIKLWKYTNQLIFYKILTQNSREFKNYTFDLGVLQFLDAHYLSTPKIISLRKIITEEDVVFLEKLIKAVHKKIVNLDFPETSNYKQSYSGILNFCDDLVSEL